MMSDKQALIDGLNDDLQRELGVVILYLYQSSVATGLIGHELREMLKLEMAGELNHAAFLADKVVVLGGKPDVTVPPLVKHKTALQMARYDLTLEREAVRAYTERVAQAEKAGELGLKVHLENMIVEETDHAEELERLIR